MKNALALLPALALTLTACGGNPEGFYARGQLTATSSTAASYHLFADPTVNYRVDSNLPQGSTSGITGSCTHGTNGWNVQLNAVGAAADQLQDVTIAVGSTAGTGSIAARVGSSTFTGTAGTSCTLTMDSTDDQDGRLTVACSGLTATGETRTLAVSADIELSECDPQNLTR